MTATESIKTADAGERTSALRRARINSFFVRTLRWILPVFAVLLLSTYAIFMQRTISIETDNLVGKLNTGTVAASLDNLSMSNPSYEGYNKKDGSRYRVSAREAITDLSRDKPVRLVDIDGSFVQPKGQQTRVKASRGLFDQTRGTLNLDGGIKVEAPNDMKVTLNSAVIDTKTSEIYSSEPVLVEMPAGQVRGNAMHLDQRAREIVFRDGVAAKLRPRAQQPVKQAEDATNAGSLLGFGGGASNAPVDITSASLAVVEKQRTAKFHGNVRAEQDGRRLEAPDLVVTFSGGPALSGTGLGIEIAATGQAEQTASGGKAPQDRLQRITASNGVKLTQGPNEARAQTAIFDVEANQAELSGGVKIKAAANRSINADLATIDTTSNRIVLTGNVAASQADSLMRGNRLIYEPKLGRMQLASPAIGGAPRGDIFVRFRQPQAKGKRRRPQTANGAAFATNPDAPIEITARSLDVRDLKSVARFDGGVRARQDKLLLTTPLLTAHYDGRIGLFSAQDGKRAGKSAKSAAMKLRFIRATKPVTVSSGDDMMAVGERAEFDMVANKVTISGNVVLKRGRQIVRGDKLIIDLKTGLSRMKNAAPDRNTAKSLTFGAAPKITANPGQRDCGGQMCAVFYPLDLQKEQTRRKGKAEPADRKSRRKPKLESGWSASTSTN